MKRQHPIVLVVDDQWGRDDDPMMQQRYASLDVQWCKSSAESSPGKYSADEALDQIKKIQPDVILLDMMFGRNFPRLGLQILERIRKIHPYLPVIMFTAVKSREDSELVVRCMELGANEFLEKPPTRERMKEVLECYTSPESDGTIYGDSPAIRALRADIARIALAARATVIIYGEIGVGKTLVARALQRFGARREGPFVHLNLADIHVDTVESKLFGHERGAFTSAVERHIGALEQADGGVLFLDEIASAPIAVQKKLLVALQERRFSRVGGTAEIKSDFQLVCASNELLEPLQVTGRMREDFVSRIATVRLVVPPLRERRSDVRMLAERYLLSLLRDPAIYESYPGRLFSKDSLGRMELYRWPHNIRELQDRIQNALIFSRHEEIDIGLLDIDPGQTAPTPGQAFEPELSVDPGVWVQDRLMAELKLAVKAKRYVEVDQGKGPKWRRSFMRLLYPLHASQNPRGCFDLVVRLTEGPWGSFALLKNPEALALIDELCPPNERRKFQAEREKRRKK